MTVKTGLEAALAASLIEGTTWDRETLTVYADHLQNEGDPRGELIALDLELAHRSTPDLVARRTSLLTGWLGRLVPSNPHTSWIGDSFRFGFVDNLVLDGSDPMHAEHLESMLDSPLAEYLARVTVYGETTQVAGVLAALAQMHHRWLSQLSLRPLGAGEIPEPTIRAFIKATPSLELLEIEGDSVFAAFPHPALRRLRITGVTAFQPLFERGNGLDAVVSLDLALFDQNLYRPTPSTVPAPFILPGLRKLDLSRNEPETLRVNPGWDPEIEYDPDVDQEGRTLPGALTVLASQPLRTQLTHLRLPSLRTADELDRLDSIAGAMPNLVEVEIVRGHYLKLPAALAKSKASFVRPSAWPWPEPAEIIEGDSLHVIAPGSRSGDTVPIVDAARVMEARFEALDADARYAWTRFWAFVAELGALPWKTDPHTTWTDTRSFPAEILVSALETCEIGGSGGWRELRDELRFRRPLPPDAMLTVHRVRTL